MSNIGWISIDRKIQDHWVWSKKTELTKFEAWFDILLTVNHKDQKVLIKNTLFTVKRGQSIKSQLTWAKRWNWSRSATRRFLELLESDSMITLKTTNKTTILTVCKYDSYQSVRTSDEQQVNIKRTTSEHQMNTNNNVNNNNNDNNEEKKEKPFNFRKSLIDYGFNENLVTDWIKVRKTKKATNTETALNKFINQVNETNADKNEILELCVENSWSGFKSHWYKPRESETKVDPLVAHAKKELQARKMRELKNNQL